jgi:hypothetical protein
VVCCAVMPFSAIAAQPVYGQIPFLCRGKEAPSLIVSRPIAVRCNRPTARCPSLAKIMRVFVSRRLPMTPTLPDKRAQHVLPANILCRSRVPVGRSAKTMPPVRPIHCPDHVARRPAAERSGSNADLAFFLPIRSIPPPAVFPGSKFGDELGVREAERPCRGPLP